MKKYEQGKQSACFFPGKPFLHWGVYVILVTIACALLKFLFHLEVLETFAFTGGRSAALRMATIILLTWACIATSVNIIDHFKHNVYTAWWSPEKERTLTWEELLLLVKNGKETDPLNFCEVERGLPCASAMAQITAAFTCILMVYAFALDFLLHPHVPSIFKYQIIKTCINKEPCTQAWTPMDANATINLSGNLTAILALIAAAISIYFTYKQVQAKVKADSRQAWIDKLRERISQTISQADHLHYKYVEAKEKGPLRKDQESKMDSETEPRKVLKIERLLTKHRLEMELMLNPSEKDHRLLIYLIQHLSLFDQKSTFLRIEDGRNFRKLIKQARGKDPEWSKILGCSSSISSKAYSDLIGYTMRVAHVVLKREWERVKVTR